MKIRHWSLLLAMLTAACAAQEDGAETEAMPDVSADAAALDAVRTGYMEHFNMDHASVVADYFRDDGVTAFADVGVRIGREEIEANLEQNVAAFDNLQIGQDAEHIGDAVAVARGTWSADVAAEGADPATVSGYYMSTFTKDDAGWKLHAVASNYDSEPTPEMVAGELSENIPEEDDTGLDALMTAYEAAWAAADLEALANLYTEDTHAAFCSSPALEGRAAVQARLEEVHAGTLDIHSKQTMEIGDGWYANGGWYEVNDPSGPWGGNYSLLARATEDGGFQTHWLVSNCRPMQAE